MPELHAPTAQPTRHEPEPHVTPLPQLLSAHVTSHATAPAHSIPPLQLPVPHETPHVPPQLSWVRQAFTPHSMLHADDVAHSTPAPQVLSPQCTSHGPLPHWIAVGHALLPSHVMSQLLAARQSTRLRH
jgi:hypothetical protein